MNTERIKKLAEIVRDKTYAKYNEWLEDFSEKHLCFNMDRTQFVSFHSDYYGQSEECGSPSCIAGWAFYMFSDDISARKDPSYIMEKAGEYLELTDDEQCELFAPANEHANIYISCTEDSRFISPERAAKVLENLAETGEVDWSIR